MENKNTANKKWYNKKGILILLLFFLPPVGVIGILLHKTKLWKKVIYVIFALFNSLWLFGLLMVLLFPVNYYDNGNDFFERGELSQAVDEYRKVDSNDKNYQNALEKIQMAQYKLDSIDEVKYLAIKKQKQDSIAKIEIRTSFQKEWADSIVKSWKGQFILSYNLKNIDTIEFELSKDATKAFNSNIKNNLPMYQNLYEKSLKYNLDLLNSNPKTIIEFIPNQKLISENNLSEWQHPVMMNTGLKIYSGNQYSKIYLGTLNCKYKDPSSGKTYYVVLKSNGNETMIENYKFREFYWVKKQDHKDRVGIGINKCY